jgi:hypothetical protein
MVKPVARWLERRLSSSDVAARASRCSRSSGSDHCCDSRRSPVASRYQGRTSGDESGGRVVKGRRPRIPRGQYPSPAFAEGRLETWHSANGRNRLSVCSGHSRRRKLVGSWIGLVSLPVLLGGARECSDGWTEDLDEATAASVRCFEDRRRRKVVKPGDCPHEKKSGSDVRGWAPASPGSSHSKLALHACLKRLKATKDDRELQRLTSELQRILFDRQYRDAGN